MFCSISGEPPQQPVVSKKSGHVYERRLIEKYITENGKDPVTGEELSTDDLLELKTESKSVPPRPPTLSSVPALLSTLQVEWDSLVLESHTLREQYTTTRKELAHALYQVDAAHRVVARLLQERDQAREALANIQANLGVAPAPAAAPSAGDVEMEDSAAAAAAGGLPAADVAKIDERSKTLSALRKKRKVPEGYATAESISSYTAKETLPSFHSPSPPGITDLALSADGQRFLTGGADKHVQIYDRASKQTVATLKGHTKKVNRVAWREAEGRETLGLSAGDKRVRIYHDTGDKGWKLASEIKTHKGEVHGLAVHPAHDYAISASADETWAVHSIEDGSTLVSAGKLDGVDGGFSYTALGVHPDGQILGAGTADGYLRIWDVRTAQHAHSFAPSAGSAGALHTLSFSENGYYVASATAESSIVQLWDLRKLKDIHAIDLGEGYRANAVSFDAAAQFLAVAGTDLRVFANKTWKELDRWEDAAAPLQAVAWGPDGKEIVAAGLDRTVRVYGQRE